MEIEMQASRLLDQAGVLVEESERTNGSNLAMFIGGQLLLVPFLGMDVTGAKKIERKALRRRIEKLQALSKQKDCG
tara:strand:+ start:1159 stop:1386 length:228 start_codon:yes stop_codon:yes gene_type:complete